MTMQTDKTSQTKIANWKACGIEEAIKSQSRRPRMVDDRTGLVYLCSTNLAEYAHHLRESAGGDQ